jgi:hypothetical protein
MGGDRHAAKHDPDLIRPVSAMSLHKCERHEVVDLPGEDWRRASRGIEALPRGPCMAERIIIGCFPVANDGKTCRMDQVRDHMQKQFSIHA